MIGENRQFYYKRNGWVWEIAGSKLQENLPIVLEEFMEYTSI